MHALVLSGDHWHPTKVVRGGLEPLTAKGFSFDWIEDARDWTPERMADYSTVILSKANNTSESIDDAWMIPEVEEAFVEFVRGGNALLVLHSGSAGYKETPALRALMGGVFESHPKQCPVTVEPKPGHPLTADAGRFTAVDEHYMMAFDDSAADVFLTTRSEHGEQPGGWTRTEGSGRVCMLTPGHNIDVWLEPSYQVLLENALRWCAGA